MVKNTHKGKFSLLGPLVGYFLEILEKNPKGGQLT